MYSADRLDRPWIGTQQRIFTNTVFEKIWLGSHNEASFCSWTCSTCVHPRHLGDPPIVQVECCQTIGYISGQIFANLGGGVSLRRAMVAFLLLLWLNTLYSGTEYNISQATRVDRRPFSARRHLDRPRPTNSRKSLSESLTCGN